MVISYLKINIRDNIMNIVNSVRTRMSVNSALGTTRKLLGRIYQIGSLLSGGIMGWTLYENSRNVKRIERENNFESEVETRSIWNLVLVSVSPCAVGTFSWPLLPVIPQSYRFFVPTAYFMTETERKAYDILLQNTRNDTQNSPQFSLNPHSNEQTSNQFLLPSCIKHSIYHD